MPRENRSFMSILLIDNTKYLFWALSWVLDVAFSAFWFKFGATLRRQAERRESGTRQKASNLAQPIS